MHTDSRPSFLRSFVTAGQGIARAVRTERNLRIQLACGAAATTLGVVLGLGPGPWACLLLVIGLMVTVELLNSAIETVVDLITPDFHPLAKIAKDVAAGAALVTAATALAVGAAVFGPPLVALTRGH